MERNLTHAVSRSNGHDAEGLDATSPMSGVATPRRIVKTLKAPLTCVTQLVQLDGGEPSAGPHLLSCFSPSNNPSEASVSEVRSELCSVAVDDPTDASTSSFFDRRLRHGRKMSSSLSRSRASRTVGGPRSFRRRSVRSNSGAVTTTSHATRDFEESFLSYSDDPSFYACDSSSSSGGSDSVTSSHSLSYAAISESVPSCSLTALGENNRSVTGAWPARLRKPNGVPRKNSGSFGSIFGSTGIDPINGTGVNPHSHGGEHGMERTSAAAAASSSTAAAAAGAKAPADARGANEHVAHSPASLTQTKKPYVADVVSSIRDNSDLKQKQGKMQPSLSTETTPNKKTVLIAEEGKDGDRRKTSGPGAKLEIDEKGNPLGDGEGQGKKVQNVKLLERVGRGSFGDVYRGEDLDTGAIIAVKEIMVPHDFTKDVEKQLSALESEIRVMRRLHHPNVVTYLGAVREQNCLRIFMEYVGGGTVGSKVKLGGGLSEEVTRVYTAQLLQGLEYLHASHILHRDLKGDNLFLTDDNVLKLGDFGQSKELADTLVTQSVQGTPSFMSPEMIACSGYSFEADVWSVGCCVIQMLTGRPPFANLDNQMAVMFAILRSKIEDQIPTTVSDGAKDFIRMCTKANTKDRWTASQLLQHPWLVGKVRETAERSVTAAPPLKATRSDSETPTLPSVMGVLLPSPNNNKPLRSILLDTAALATTNTVDLERDAAPRSGGGGTSAPLDIYDVGLGDETAEQDTGGTPSSSRSAKGESPTSKTTPSQKRKQLKANGSANDPSSARRLSPTAPKTSPNGRPPRIRGGGGATPAQESGNIVTQNGKGETRSPRVPKPHRPTQSPTECSPRSRVLLASANGTDDGSGSVRRRSLGGAAVRGSNTPINQRHLDTSSPSRGRGASRVRDTSIQRVSSVGNQTNRTTPNSTPSISKVYKPTTTRGASVTLRDGRKK